jgi:hypothetical protein
MHSTTMYRRAKVIENIQRINHRCKVGALIEETLRDGFTDADREVSEQQEAGELFREFLSTEMI